MYDKNPTPEMKCLPYMEKQGRQFPSFVVMTGDFHPKGPDIITPIK